MGNSSSMGVEEVMLQAFIEQQKAWEAYAAASNRYHELLNLLATEQLDRFQDLAKDWLRATYKP